MKIDSAAWPFVLVASVPGVLSLWLGPALLTGVLLVLPIAVAAFFRDPERASPQDASLVLAPADGRVTFAGDARPEEAPDGRWRQVTIFLSVFDVHINRTPVSGRVTRVEYRRGAFLPAYRREAYRNEQSEIWLDHAGAVVVARQVVGVLARRVVCRVRPGDELEVGERIGLMKFGSRMDVFMPADAAVAVRAGDTVRAGMTPIGRLQGRPS